MKNKIHLLVLISIFTYVFIFLHTNLDDIVLYKIVGEKYGVDYSLSMNSPTWLDEWNRLLHTNLYSNTPIDIWKWHIISNGLELQGFAERGSFIHNMTNWIKIGLSGIALTLIIFICKKSVFKPVRNFKEYLKNRRSFLNSEMDETIKFLENLKNIILLNESEEKDIHKCNICIKKIPNFITDFDKLKYKPIYAIRLINDIEKSYYKNILKNEVEEYSNLIDLVINLINEIKAQEISNKQSILPRKELFPIAKRTVEYYSKNSWFYISYCAESNQNKILKKWFSTFVYFTYLSLSGIFIYILIVSLFVFAISGFLTIFALFNITSIKGLEITIDYFLSNYNMIIFGIIYFFPIISISCLFISNIPKNFKSKFKNIFSIFIILLIATTIFIFVFIYIKFFAMFPQFEDTNYTPPLHESLQYVLYNILSLSLFLYWFISLTHLIRTERKINFIMIIKEVILPLICLIIFILIKINDFRLVTFYLICIWVSIMAFEYFIWNLICFLINPFYKSDKSSSVSFKSNSIRESTVTNYIEDTVTKKGNEEFVITYDSKDTKYREKENMHIENYDEYYEVIEYILYNNPENMENVAKKFETSLENVEKYLKEYLCNNSKNDKSNNLVSLITKIYNKFILWRGDKKKNKQENRKKISITISSYISIFKYSFIIIELMLLLLSLFIFYFRLTSSVILLISIYGVLSFSFIGLIGIYPYLFHKKKLIINLTEFRFFLIFNILTFNIFSLILIIIIYGKIRTLTIFQNYMKSLNKNKTEKRNKKI
ncbi:hypothetical protein [Mycoplasma sp. HU2014]|uniref:hypothetical protein n=1 Tax=Mycoplasma sp. HU2014 TaxID=1664275 RepID=UPI00067A9057|nr:hypothetical protein [Mycoplasma sp. HU2014]KNG79629.1 membrane protein [Mycoplasma sp. HU2014]